MLLRQKLPNARAQYRAPVGTPAVGCSAAAFELHLPARAVEHPFEDGDGTAVAIAVAGAEGTLVITSYSIHYTKLYDRDPAHENVENESHQTDDHYSDNNVVVISYNFV